MAYIYKITNQINGKCYIGKTLENNPEKRWDQHLKNRFKEKDKNRPLYRAINKYGIENFVFEVLVQVDSSIINEKEQEYIQLFNSFKNGYNATLGGDGRHYLNYDVILSTYQNFKNIKMTAEHCGCDKHTVSNLLKSNNIPIETSQNVIKKKYGKKVLQFNLQNEFLTSFDSLMSAALYMVKNNLTGCKDSTIRSHISEVCRGKRRTAAGFIWKFEV